MSSANDQDKTASAAAASDDEQSKNNHAAEEKKEQDASDGVAAVNALANSGNQSTATATRNGEDGVDTKLFVGQVPNTTSESDLHHLFSPFGDVKDVFILTDRVTGVRKGCAFVTLGSSQAAQRAIDALDTKMTLPGGKQAIVVRLAGTKSDEGDVKLYVGMLARTSTEEDIRALFEPFGEVTEVFIMRNRDNGSSKGCAFVKYARREEATRAINALHGRHKDGTAPSMLQVRFAHTSAEKNTQRYNVQPNMMMGMPGMMNMQGGGMMNNMMAMNPYGYAPASGGTTAGVVGHGGMNSYGNPMLGTGYDQPGMVAPMVTAKTGGGGGGGRGPMGANLFVYNVPDFFQDSDMYNLFAACGNIVSASVFKDKMTGQGRGFGFVSYDNPQSAQTAISMLNGYQVGGKRLDVRLKKGEEQASVPSMHGNRYQPY